MSLIEQSYVHSYDVSSFYTKQEYGEKGGGRKGRM